MSLLPFFTLGLVDRFIASFADGFDIPAKALHRIAGGRSQHEPAEGTREHELADHSSYPFSIH